MRTKHNECGLTLHDEKSFSVAHGAARSAREEKGCKYFIPSVRAGQCLCLWQEASQCEAKRGTKSKSSLCFVACENCAATCSAYSDQPGDIQASSANDMKVIYKLTTRGCTCCARQICDQGSKDITKTVLLSDMRSNSASMAHCNFCQVCARAASPPPSPLADCELDGTETWSKG
eukprot:5524469-Amphidinium_carterae.1